MSNPDQCVGSPEFLNKETQLIEVVKKLTYPQNERWRMQHGLVQPTGDAHLNAHYFISDIGLRGWFPTNDENKEPFDIELLYRPYLGEIFLFSDQERHKMAALSSFCSRFNIDPTQILPRLKQLHEIYDISSQQIKVVSPIDLSPQYIEEQYPPSIVMVAKNHNPEALREVYGLDQFGSPFGFTCQYNGINDGSGDILSGVSVEPISQRALHYSNKAY